jgi:RNA polymerase nonessential primary-like sigma factor
VRDRFGVAGREPRTLAAIGRDVGMSRERVRQIQEESLTRLRRDHEVAGLRRAA